MTEKYKVKVLVVAGGFYPAKKYGGPVVSLDNMCSLLHSDIEFYLVARNHDFGDNLPLPGIKSGWNQRDNCQVFYLPEEDVSKNTFLNIFEKVSPDITYINSLFDADFTLPFLDICKQFKCPVLLAPRGQLCAGAMNHNSAKKAKKIIYLSFIKARGMLKNVSYQSTSDEETESIRRYLSAKQGKIFFLTNIPAMLENECTRVAKKGGEGRFIFLSRIHPKKNLASAIRFFDGIRGKVVFDIYGPIEDKGYWASCQKIIATLPKNVTVNYCGLVDHGKILQTFSRYDAFLFPTFSENYGHVIAESLIAGTPVIISDQTPWNDVNSSNSGWAIPLGEPEKFVKAIQTIIDSDCSELRKNVRNYIKDKIQYDELREEYREVFNSLKKSSKCGG